MIPKPYIAKWQEHAPWKEFSQVEQDLIISRVLIEILTNDDRTTNRAIEVVGYTVYFLPSNEVMNYLFSF